MTLNYFGNLVHILVTALHLSCMNLEEFLTHVAFEPFAHDHFEHFKIELNVTGLLFRKTLCIKRTMH
jgi:hypothetical protein